MPPFLSDLASGRLPPPGGEPATACGREAARFGIGEGTPSQVGEPAATTALAGRERVARERERGVARESNWSLVPLHGTSLQTGATHKTLKFEHGSII